MERAGVSLCRAPRIRFRVLITVLEGCDIDAGEGLLAADDSAVLASVAGRFPDRLAEVGAVGHREVVVGVASLLASCRKLLEAEGRTNLVLLLM